MSIHYIEKRIADSDKTVSATSFTALTGCSFGFNLPADEAPAHVELSVKAVVSVDDANAQVDFDLELDGTRLGNTRGLATVANPTLGSGDDPIRLTHLNFSAVVPAMAAGNHTLKLVGKASAMGVVGTVKAGAATWPIIMSVAAQRQLTSMLELKEGAR